MNRGWGWATNVRVYGIVATMITLAVAALGVGLVVLLSNNGGLTLTRVQHAHPQDRGIVAQLALASERVVLRRGTRWVYMQGMVFEVTKNERPRDLNSRPNPPQA